MSWQRCSLCEGTGIDPNINTSFTMPVCPVCNGEKIISVLTAEPPSKVNKTKKDNE